MRGRVAVLYAIGALIESVFFVPMMALSPSSAANPLAGFGWFLVVLFPFFGAVAGFIGGVIGAALYNLVAGWTGGLQLRFAVEPAPESFSAG